MGFCFSDEGLVVTCCRRIAGYAPKDGTTRPGRKRKPAKSAGVTSATMTERSNDRWGFNMKIGWPFSDLSVAGWWLAVISADLFPTVSDLRSM